MHQNGSRVLLVDDNAELLRAHARMIAHAGYEVQTAPDGESAVRAMQGGNFDVVVSDIDMPGMNGIQLLERVRSHDLDVPVIMVTGSPSIETAIRAMEHGALRYLVKPVDPEALVKVVSDAVRLHRLAEAKRQALELAGGADRLAGDRASLATSFSRALDGLYMAYQPIVSWSKKNVFGIESLMRTKEPALPHPGAMLDAAERLDRIHQLSRKIRQRSVEPIARMPEGALLFVNLHPHDLLDDHLLTADAPLSRVANQVVLEITERASLHGVGDVQGIVAKLRSRGFRIALDDFGAGYAGLTSFALLEPEVVKLDMGLVRNLDKEPTKQTLVRTMISMCKELGIHVIAEGIETEGERDELLAAGCDLMQGYLFARPGDAFPEVKF